jgi:hypothetical protein
MKQSNPKGDEILLSQNPKGDEILLSQNPKGELENVKENSTQTLSERGSDAKAMVQFES